MAALSREDLHALRTGFFPSHGVHHRGQAHAMLVGTAVTPPQLDEFVMPSEAGLRVGDVAGVLHKLDS
jgi:hypothetical protein